MTNFTPWKITFIGYITTSAVGIKVKIKHSPYVIAYIIFFVDGLVAIYNSRTRASFVGHICTLIYRAYFFYNLFAFKTFFGTQLTKIRI